MKIGAVFPHLEIGNDPMVIKDWAQAAEGLGYSHLLVYDHVLGAVHAERDPPLWGPYSEQSAFHELFVLLGIFRYQLLSNISFDKNESGIKNKFSAESPEEILLNDKGITLTIFGWFITIILINFVK